MSASAYGPPSYFSSTMMSQIRAGRSAWGSALVLASDSEVFFMASSSTGPPVGASSFCLRSSSRLEMDPSSAVDPNFLFKFDFNEDFLLSSAEEKDCLELLLASFSPIRLLVESLRMEPLEHSTSSEKETREFLEDRLEAPEEAEEEAEVLSGLTGTTTGDSAEQFSQLATLSLASLPTVPSSLQKLSLANRLWPCSRSRYFRPSVNRSR